ncbi:hypothetical protein ACJQWK_06284 [Exserohilum turcicum]|uniref:Uncharacterized protein n=1 Tax=Exserohilum turcicum (strain 28A) TaxID=671987 RepID=R0JWX7_EXST2|nr:uncharacterized protein SETTUDRAFT_42493 [Exserohilum turcica Et28A]EOA85448.1 hypothetical protein SETTUDRAFT_42493 [Exserohilum turcica Et28A]
MRAAHESYATINGHGHGGQESTPWYWRLIAMAASWMIVAGYLVLPGLYAKDAQLRFTDTVLAVFVVALLTAGYSFTVLLCFACRDRRFQAEGVFLPALTSSALGLASIAYNFLASHAYRWGTAATMGTALSAVATLVYSSLCLYTYARLHQPAPQPDARANLWSEQSYYNNFVVNMYPTAVRSPSQPLPPAHHLHLHQPVYTDDDRVSQQMALLLSKSDSRPSLDANSTFRIDLPVDPNHDEQDTDTRELVATPGHPPSGWNRDRADSCPDSLGEHQAWQRLHDRGRTTIRPQSSGGRSSQSRNLSREERRREIELGDMHV